LALPVVGGIALSNQLVVHAYGDSKFDIKQPRADVSSINKGCSVENMFLDQESITGIPQDGSNPTPESLPTIPLSEVQADHGEEVIFFKQNKVCCFFLFLL